MAKTNSDLLDEVYISRQVMGEINTIEVLKNARANYFSDKLATDVIAIIAVDMSVNVDELKKQKSSDERKVFLAFSAYCLREILRLSYSQIQSTMPILLSLKSIQNYRRFIIDAKIEKPKSCLDRLISKHYHNIVNSVQKEKEQQSKTKSNQNGKA